MANRVSPTALLVLVLLLILLLSPSSPPASDYESELVKSVVSRERDALSIANASHYGDFQTTPPAEGASALNLTGFRAEDGFEWFRLPAIQDRVRAQFDFATSGQAARLRGSDETLLAYRNVTGWAKGRWSRARIAVEESPTNINRTLLDARLMNPARQVTHNVTGYEGKLDVFFNDKHGQSVEEQGSEYGTMSVRIVIQDTSSYGDGWSFRLHGVHDRKSGSMLLSTNSDKYVHHASLHRALTCIVLTIR